MDYSSSTRPSRLAIEETLTPISSPKRKREYDSDSDHDSRRASPMRFRTELPSRPRIDEELGSPTSPRSKVSRQLNDLKLNKPDLVFSTPVSAFGQGQASIDSSGSWDTSSPPTEPEADPLIIEKSPLPPSSPQEIPSTPILQPTLATQLMTTSPVSLSSLSPAETATKSVRMRSPPPQPLSTGSRSSPPPYSGLTWTASEITGHNPTDPADDGYGINGIGFRPTPAMAQARSQRRKQQVAEWRTREAKEARQRRMDRRRKTSAEIEDQGGGGSTAAAAAAAERRRVRFVEG